LEACPSNLIPDKNFLKQIKVIKLFEPQSSMINHSLNQNLISTVAVINSCVNLEDLNVENVMDFSNSILTNLDLNILAQLKIFNGSFKFHCPIGKFFIDQLYTKCHNLNVLNLNCWFLCVETEFLKLIKQNSNTIQKLSITYPTKRQDVIYTPYSAKERFFELILKYGQNLTHFTIHTNNNFPLTNYISKLHTNCTNLTHMTFCVFLRDVYSSEIRIHCIKKDGKWINNIHFKREYFWTPNCYDQHTNETEDNMLIYTQIKELKKQLKDSIYKIVFENYTYNQDLADCCSLLLDGYVVEFRVVKK
jgi:hypothetical protein